MNKRKRKGNEELMQIYISEPRGNAYYVPSAINLLRSIQMEKRDLSLKSFQRQFVVDVNGTNG